MKKESIALIHRQIEKLEVEEFNLEAWKASTVSILQRILGETDPRIKTIEKLTIDYSSWALRDATSRYNPEQTCKKKGKEILENLTEEIALLGLPNAKKSPDELLKNVLSNESIESIKEKKEVLKILKKEKKEALAKALQILIESL